MFLKKIVIKNFKCLSDIEFSFENNELENRKWTLILGENGTGKSNLLKAIALILAGGDAFVELLGNAKNWVMNGQEGCVIYAEVITQDGKEINLELKINREGNLLNALYDNQRNFTEYNETIKLSAESYFILAYGASRRLSNETFSSFDKDKSPRFINVRNLFDNSAVLNPLTSWIIDLDYRLGDKGIALVKEALDDFLPDITFHSIDKNNKQVLFNTLDGVVSLSQLSEGYQNMAAWIGDLLFRVTDTFKDVKKPLEVRGVLLIDEIDLHLHPKWQRKLYDFISEKLPNFQVIATTHSPLTAQQAGENELFALKRNANNIVELIPFKGSPKNLLVNQLLMTPVFGLETDESYEVEKQKAEYSALKSKGDSLNEAEKKVFIKLQAQLKKELPKRQFSFSSDKEMALLEKIEKTLNLK